MANAVRALALRRREDVAVVHRAVRQVRKAEPWLDVGRVLDRARRIEVQHQRRILHQRRRVLADLDCTPRSLERKVHRRHSARTAPLAAEEVDFRAAADSFALRPRIVAHIRLEERRADAVRTAYRERQHVMAEMFFARRRQDVRRVDGLGRIGVLRVEDGPRDGSRGENDARRLVHDLLAALAQQNVAERKSLGIRAHFNAQTARLRSSLAQQDGAVAVRIANLCAFAPDGLPDRVRTTRLGSLNLESALIRLLQNKAKVDHRKILRLVGDCDLRLPFRQREFDAHLPVRRDDARDASNRALRRR